MRKLTTREGVMLSTDAEGVFGEGTKLALRVSVDDDGEFKTITSTSTGEDLLKFRQGLPDGTSVFGLMSLEALRIANAIFKFENGVYVVLHITNITVAPQGTAEPF